MQQIEVSLIIKARANFAMTSAIREIGKFINVSKAFTPKQLVHVIFRE